MQYYFIIGSEILLAAGVAGCVEVLMRPGLVCLLLDGCAFADEQQTLLPTLMRSFVTDSAIVAISKPYLQ